MTAEMTTTALAMGMATTPANPTAANPTAAIVKHVVGRGWWADAPRE